MFGFNKENREELADALTADVVDNDLIENLLVAAHMRHMEISSSNSSRGKGMLTAADYDAIEYAYREGELDKYKTSRSDAAVWSSLGFPEEKHSAARHFFAKLRERNGHAVLTNSGHRLGTAYKSLLPAGYQSVFGPFVERAALRMACGMARVLPWQHTLRCVHSWMLTPHTPFLT